MAMWNPNRMIMGVSKGVSRGFKGVSLLMQLCVCIKYLSLVDPLKAKVEFLLYYLTKPEYHLKVREAVYLDNALDLF